MAVSLLPRWLLLAFSLALVACGGGGSSSPQITELSGFVVNGVLVGATVTVRSQSGELVAESITNKDGRFDAELSRAEPPFFLEAQGGRLAGEPYVGTLKAWCPKPEKEGPLRCDVTPYTTLLVYLMEQQDIAYGEAVRAVNNVLQLEQDPFIQAMATGAEVPIDRFDLDAARQQIDGGAGLEGWLDDFSAWVLAPDAAPLPAGSPTFVIRLTTGPGGMGAPSEVTLRWGEVATFNLTPDLNFEVVSALGCGGKLSAGNTVYTTAPVKGVGPVSGVCSVNVSFALRRYDVKYVPVKFDPAEESCADAVSEDGVEPGSFGIIEGNNEQRVAHGLGSSPVTAVAAEGYTFRGWSDDNSNALRTDPNITENKEFKACFEINEYSVEYFAGANGSIDGDLNQLVKFGDDASTVTAQPASGFLFLRWSDGLEDAERTDEDIRSDLALTAFFQADSSLLPWLTSVHDGALDLWISGPGEVVVNWDAEADVSYNLYVASAATTEISSAMLLEDVMPLLSIDSLNEGEPAYIALEANDELIAWSSTVPRTLGVNGTVWTQKIDVSGNRYVGGDFSRVLLNQAYATVLPQVGAGGPLSSHPLAIAEINGEVRAAAKDGLGGLFIAGNFSEAGGEPRSGLAHIDASGRVTDWVPSLVGQVNALVVVGDNVYVGGEFTEAGGAPRENLAAFDSGGTVLPWAPTANGPVYELLSIGDILYIGGHFNEVDDEARHNLAAINIDGEAEVQPWDARTDGPVYALEAFQGLVLVGGDFTQTTDSAGGISINRSLGAFQAYDYDSPPDPDGPPQSILDLTSPRKTDGVVYTLALSATRLYIGGEFTFFDGEPRTNVAAITETDILDWAPSLSGPVRTIVAVGDLVYLGGDSLSGSQGLLAFDEEGDPTSWEPGLESGVNVLVPYGEVVFAGGGFKGVAGNRERNNLAAFGPEGELLDWNPDANGVVRALIAVNDDLYIGGDFTQVSAESRRGLAAVGLLGAALDGQLLSWDPVIVGSVMSMDVNGSTFYVGGDFSAAGSGLSFRSHLAAFDLSGMLQSWAPEANAPVRAVLATPSLVYVGGEFTEVDGESRAFLAGVDGAGVLSPVWAPVADGAVNALMMLSGDIYVGGEFSAVDATSREGLAAIETDGTLLPWNPSVNGPIWALTAISGDIYVGGDFSEANAEWRGRLAAFDDTGALLPWAPEVDDSARSLQGFASDIYVGGDFMQVEALMPLLVPSWRQRLAIFDLGGNLLPR